MMVIHIIGLLIFICLLGWLIYDYTNNDGWCDFLTHWIISPSFWFYLAAFWITAIIICGILGFLGFLIHDIFLLLPDPVYPPDVAHILLEN